MRRSHLPRASHTPRLSKAPNFLTLGAIIVIILTVATGLRLVRSSHASIQPAHTSDRWMMTTSLINKLISTDPQTASYFFDTSNAFAKSSAASGFQAIPLASYTSYAQFAQDLADGSFPTADHWVMYGIESTTPSPLVEQQQPDVYLPKFAALAHAHNLKVMEVPGRDLVFVQGSDCHALSDENIDTAYLRCHIPADADAADIYQVEAQGDQPSVSPYNDLVLQAIAQVRAGAPGITVMSGLTTDRGDSAAQIEACWSASHTEVAGYWMNSTSATLAEAAQVLDFIATSSQTSSAAPAQATSNPTSAGNPASGPHVYASQSAVPPPKSSMVPASSAHSARLTGLAPSTKPESVQPGTWSLGRLMGPGSLADLLASAAIVVLLALAAYIIYVRYLRPARP